MDYIRVHVYSTTSRLLMSKKNCLEFSTNDPLRVQIQLEDEIWGKSNLEQASIPEIIHSMNDSLRQMIITKNYTIRRTAYKLNHMF